MTEDVGNAEGMENVQEHVDGHHEEVEQEVADEKMAMQR